MPNQPTTTTPATSPDNTLATAEEAIRMNRVLLDGYIKIQEILAFDPVYKKDIIEIIQSTLEAIA